MAPPWCFCDSVLIFMDAVGPGPLWAALHCLALPCTSPTCPAAAQQQLHTLLDLDPSRLRVEQAICLQSDQGQSHEGREGYGELASCPRTDRVASMAPDVAWRGVAVAFHGIGWICRHVVCGRKPPGLRKACEVWFGAGTAEHVVQVLMTGAYCRLALL